MFPGALPDESTTGQASDSQKATYSMIQSKSLRKLYINLLHTIDISYALFYKRFSIPFQIDSIGIALIVEKIFF